MAQLMWSAARKLARIRSLLIVHPHIHNVRMRQKSVVLDVNQLGTPSRWFVKVVQFLGKLMYCVLLVTTLKAHKRVMYGIVPHSSKSTYPFSIALDQQAISSIWTCAVDHQSLLAYKIYIANGHCCCRSETLDSVWNKRNHMYATNWMSYHCVLWYSHHTQVFSHSYSDTDQNILRQIQHTNILQDMNAIKMSAIRWCRWLWRKQPNWCKPTPHRTNRRHWKLFWSFSLF